LSKYGVFSEIWYLNVHIDVQLLSDTNFQSPSHQSLQYAWNHYLKDGHREHRYIVIESNGRYYKGFISLHPKYFKKNNVSSLFYRRRNDNVWSHYSKHGYNARHLIGINNVTEITLCNYTLTPVNSLNICKSKLSKPVVLVLTHAWGGGTELFEDELLLFTQFHFIFYRFDWKMNHMQLHAYYQQNKVYKSYWLPPPREIVQVRTISFFIFFTPMIDDFRLSSTIYPTIYYW